LTSFFDNDFDEIHDEQQQLLKIGFKYKSTKPLCWNRYTLSTSGNLASRLVIGKKIVIGIALKFWSWLCY